MAITIYNQDCIDLEFENKVDLVYMDPPYSSKIEDVYYGVGDNFEEFLQYMKYRLFHIYHLMKDNSNILVHMDYKAIHYIKVIMDQIFGRNNFQNEIIWGFSSPSVASRYLPRKHQTILWYGMGNYTFNKIRIPYTSKLSVGGKASWAKKDVDASKYVEKGKSLEDWWIDIPYLCRNESEKVGYDTQKPLALAKRILEIFSNEGDTVLDPFMGSGTFPYQADKMNRNAIGCDISNKAIEIAKGR